MSNFSKKVMIEAAELDRMQQNQIKSYSPELHSLAQLHNQMLDIIGDKTMSSDQKLNILSSYQGRFNKIKKETGVLIGKDITEPDAEPAPAAVAPAPLIVNQAPTNSNDDDSSESILGKIPSMYHIKAKKLLSKIKDHPDILKYNKDGEIVVKGKTVTGTDFTSLFKSMVGPKPDLNQPGTESFMGALHEIGVKPIELSGKAVQSKYAQSMYVEEEELDENNNEPPPKPAPTTKKSSSSASRQKKTVAQKGKGLKRKTGGPPGTRPKILYVY